METKAGPAAENKDQDNVDTEDSATEPRLAEVTPEDAAMAEHKLIPIEVRRGRQSTRGDEGWPRCREQEPR